LGDVTLEGHLAIPEEPGEIVIFAHGSGSSRHSPRNRLVAKRLNEARLATLLFDLLTKGEQLADQTTGEFRFDILLLARRLADTVDSVTRQWETAGMNIGLFGASTGAAAALITAAERTNEVAAVVSRGGRPRSCMGIITASEFRIPWRHLIAPDIWSAIRAGDVLVFHSYQSVSSCVRRPREFDAIAIWRPVITTCARSASTAMSVLSHVEIHSGKISPSFSICSPAIPVHRNFITCYSRRWA
jgi:pimeloyl-ACP methyl ester carboxylesterase